MPRARKTEATQAAESTDPEALPAERDETPTTVLQIGPLTGTVEDIQMPGVGGLVTLPAFCLADLIEKNIVTLDIEPVLGVTEYDDEPASV